MDSVLKILWFLVIISSVGYLYYRYVTYPEVHTAMTYTLKGSPEFKCTEHQWQNSFTHSKIKVFCTQQPE